MTDKMRNEIGSEFWTQPPSGGSGVSRLLPPDFSSLFVLSGRTAQEIAVDDILRSQAIKKAYLPSYCCHTMIEPFLRHHIAVEFYDITVSGGKIRREFNADNDCELVFLIDYFGYRESDTEEIAHDQAEKGKILLYDATHSIFCENNDFSPYDYVFGSFRKWFGVNSGFVAKRGGQLADATLSAFDAYTQMRNRAFDLKAAYMDGKAVEKKEFLDLFASAEETLETDYLRYAPDAASLSKLQTADVDTVRHSRRENAKYLIERLQTLSGIDLPFGNVQTGDCPLFVPITVGDGKRDAVRKALINAGIYLPVHWPLSALHTVGTAGKALYASELSCVCDQRYGEADMEHLYRLLRSSLSK